MKNILIYFAPLFVEFGADVALALRREYPGLKVHGLVGGSSTLIDRLRNRLGDCAGEFVAWEHGPEADWISREATKEDCDCFEHRYPIGTFGRTITSDRRIGRGFVTGGFAKPHALGDLSLSDPKRVPRNYVINLYRFLEDFFDRNEIDLAFSYVVANAPAFAMSVVAQNRGKPFLQIAPMRVGVRYTVDTGHLNRYEPIQRRFLEFKSDPERARPWIGEAEAFVADFRARPQGPEYQAVNEELATRRVPWKATLRFLEVYLKQKALNIVTPVGSRRTKIARARFAAEVAWRAKSIGDKFFRKQIDLTGDYAYFPLHLDPEAAMMVFAPFCTDQAAVIEAIAKSLPAGMRLVVKEHVMMIGKRDATFYRRITGLPNVELVSPKFSTFDLMQRSRLTITISGTAGWEAFCLGIPTLVVGHSYYADLGSGVVVESDPSRYAQAIKRAMEMPPVDTDDLCLFVAAILSRSFDLEHRLLEGGQYHKMSREKQNEVSGAVAGLMHELMVEERSSLHNESRSTA